LTASRRLALLLASGLLGLAPAAPALGQSAGDEQHADPLAGSGDGGGSSQTTTPELTDEPQASGSASGSAGSGSSGAGSAGAGAGSGSSGAGSGSSGAPAGSSSSGSGAAPSAAPVAPTPSAVTAGASAGSPTSGASASPRSQLPNTGAEPGIVAALGSAFVLLGIGLRLRTADVCP